MFDSITNDKWWDIGLDLVTGCTPVSPACDHCWSAERTHHVGQQRNPVMRRRYGGLTKKGSAGFQPVSFTGEVRPQWDFLDRIGSAKKPQVYAFWNDLFHPGVRQSFISEVMFRIIDRPQHFYIICTKRPERALNYFSKFSDPNFTNQLMLMTTVENQRWADIRLPQLLAIPGVLHGVSLEPLLAPINLIKWLKPLAGGQNENSRNSIFGINSSESFFSGCRREDLEASAHDRGKPSRCSFLQQRINEASPGRENSEFGLSQNNVFCRPEEINSFCTSHCLDDPQSCRYRRGITNQPQERGSNRHSSGQFGEDDPEGKRPPCGEGFEKGTISLTP